MANITSIYNFADAVRVANGKDKVRIGHNTELRKLDNSTYFVTLHGHAIASFHAEGFNEYSTAGWVTTTTFDRLNQLSDALRFSRKRGLPHVSVRGNKPVYFERFLTFMLADDFLITDEQMDKAI
jgi:hypothetical protein